MAQKNDMLRLALMGGAGYFLLKRAGASSEETSTQLGGGGSSGSRLLLVPNEQQAVLGISESLPISNAPIESKKSQKTTTDQLSEQYNTYQENLLNTPVSSQSYTNTSFSNQTKKGEVTASYKTITETKVTQTLGGKEVITQTKKQEKIPGTEWTVSAAPKTSFIGGIVANIKQAITNPSTIGSWLRRR